jgi:aryl-phospho-beta-D-glucosidase BglC (GH1 family)
MKKLSMHNIKLTIKILIILLTGVPVLVSAQLSPKEAISQMRHGINLGNTLEPPLEGEWGNPSTQEYMFDMYKKEGFNFVRIPVRWDRHIGTTSPYKIDETWFKRVEQILDWGLSKGLYVVVNSHHDGWIKENYANPINQVRFDSLWSQVATRFKNKSEKLIFEICNEPVSPMTKAQNDEMHQKAINRIRKTNPTRLILFQGIDWGGSDALINAAIPNDPYIIGSFHSYDPYLFGLEGQGTWGTSSDISTLRTKFQKVKDWSDKNNIPVFLGEFGSIKTADYNSRMKHYKTYMELSETFGFAPAAWDDGGDFRIMNRSAKTWDDDIKDILTHSSLLSPRMPRLSIFQDTIVKLDWTNPATDYDSIYIERKNVGSTYRRVAALKGNAVTFSDIKLPQNKEYIYRVIAHYNSSTSDLYSYPQKILLPTYVPKEPVFRQLFTGQPLAIPGRIEAENFDIGEDGLTYHDSDTKNVTGALRPSEPIDIYDLGRGTYYVIDNYPGEWLEYTVNVTEKGSYNINAIIAAFAGGGTFKLKIGSVESDIIKAPTTYSWVNTKPSNFSMNLEAGIQIMRLTFIDSPLFYIDYMEFKRIIPVGISPINDNHFSIFQQQQELIFNLGTNDRVESLKIYNILGSVVKTIRNPGANFRISTQGIQSGVYLIQLISGNQKFSKKIVIN